MKPPAGAPGDTGPAPASARALFPAERLALAERYCELLATDGVVRGLIGPREVPRLWDRHLVNCGLLATALPQGASVADVGSGAGLPGLVIGISRPDLRVTLIEPLLRRTTFLEEVVAALGLTNVEVVRGRADALHGQRAFDVVTARAVAPLERLVGWCMPLVDASGSVVAMKGDSAQKEIAAARPVLQRLGCATPVIEVLSAAGPSPEVIAHEEPSAPTTRVVRVTWAGPPRVSLPTSGGREAARNLTSRSSRRKRRAS